MLGSFSDNELTGAIKERDEGPGGVQAQSGQLTKSSQCGIG